MAVILSDYAHKQLNNLYSNWMFFKNDKEFSEAFKYYNKCLLRDFDRFSSGGLTYTIHRRYRRVILPSVQIFYRVAIGGMVIITSFLFVGLGRVQKLTAIEKKELNSGVTSTRRPSHIVASTNVADYEPSNLNGGTISGIAVQVVKRKGVTTVSNKPVFNYLYKGRILSRYDFINTTPFSNYNGVEKAYADAANGYRYWILPTRRTPIRMNETVQQKTQRIIAEQINKFLMKNGICIQNKKCI